MNSTPDAVTASLDDPRYYLANFRFVLAWVSERHGDLFSDTEHAFLTGFRALPEAAQALLVRLVMRKGEHFRTSRLLYPEIGDTEAALAPLVAAGWVTDDPSLDVATLVDQLRLAELRQAFAGEIAAAGLPAKASKAALGEALLAREPAPRPLAAWWPEAPDRVVRLEAAATCERLRLMFFGNLRQDWSAFVLAELGVQRFESVAITPEARAFQARHEVDAYLALQRLRERLEAGDAPGELFAAMPEVPADNAWLAGRRRRLWLALARQAERNGEPQVALEAYAAAGEGPSGLGEARIRHLRLLERQGRHAEAPALAEARPPSDEAERQAQDRLVPRLLRRLGRTVPAPPAPTEPERIMLTLPPRAGIEAAVCDHLHRDAAPVYYVENALLTGLFGLLCWEAIFAPLPGAFFHPFQAGPADLYREDFVARRRTRFDACLARLEDGRYGRAIRATWRAKHGIASPFVNWSVLDQTLIELALACLPATDLRACFERLLGDPKANRAGLPDLIQFRPEAPAGASRYRMIEVKGPGDRLQDNQRRWLAFFQARNLPVAVCRVRWATGA